MSAVRCMFWISDAESDPVRCGRVQLKCDGTRWRTGGEVKRGKLANGVGSQYPSHYLGTWCIQHYYRWCAHLGCAVVDWTDASPPAGLNGLVCCAERRNLVSAHVPSHFKWPLETCQRFDHVYFLYIEYGDTAFPLNVTWQSDSTELYYRRVFTITHLCVKANENVVHVLHIF